MAYAQLTRSVLPYLWPTCIALFSLSMISGSLYAQTIISSATLTVIKVVINDNGGTLGPSDFFLKVTGNNPSPDLFSGAGAPGTLVALDPGKYEVVETPPSGYAVSYSADCSGTMAMGDARICIVTNDDIAPTLRLVKTVVNDNGGTATNADFQAQISGVNYPWNTDIPLNAGNYVVSESSHPHYTTLGWGGDCKITGDITLAVGDPPAVCTITNDDIASTLRLVKTVVNDNGGTAVANDFQAKIDGNNVAWNTEIPVLPGLRTASESNLPAYAPSAWGGDCAANGQVTLAFGDKKVCTITNDDSATTLKLVKTVVNNNGGVATVASFQAKIDGSNVAWNTAIPVTPGPHTASEVNLPGYVASAWGGDCASNGQVTLAQGENKICTITNDDAQATLIVIKKVINDHGGTLTAAQFNLKVTGSNPNPATFAGSETGTVVSLGPGNYTVSETPPSGYTVTYSPECSGAIALGETKTCTVTNNDAPARLRIVKQVINDNGGTLTVPNFPLFIDGIPVTSGVFMSVTAGLHIVSETPHPRYAATFSNNCAGGQTTLSLGQQRTCTLTNNDRPLGIILQKSASSSSVQPGTVVNYAYRVGNTTDIPLTNISLSDDKCTPVQPVKKDQSNIGDTNQDNNLDLGEEWQYTCTSTLLVDTLNTATAQGIPLGGGTPVIDTAQVTVDVRATIQVTKTPSALSVPPAGGLVNFTLKIRNLSQGDQVTLQNLHDDRYGNLTDANNPHLEATNCVAGRLLAPNNIYTCTFTAFVDGTLGDHVNTVLVTGIDDDDQPVSGSASATVQVNGSLFQPTKSAVLAVDADQNSVASAGDTLEYTVMLPNKGTEQALGIVFEDAPDDNTTLVSGSVQTSRGSVTLGNGPGHTVVAVDVGTVNANATVTIRFKVKINEPLPMDVTKIENQGFMRGENVALISTDDPNTLEVGDPTVTPLTAVPLIKGVKTVHLFTDADNNGFANAGDILEYEVHITNQGSRTANNVILNDTVDPQTVLEIGSVQTSRGSVSAGNQAGDSAVLVNLGNLAGGASGEITFRVAVKNPLPVGITHVSNQGLISGSNFPTTVTDDPTTLAINDPTKTQVTPGPALDATKLATLSIDADQNGQPGPGDTLHYQVRMLNSGTAAANGLAFVDKLDANTTLLAGSVTTTQGNITRGNANSDQEVNVTINTISAGGEVVVTYKALVNDPLPPTVLKVANQGVVTSQELPPVLTDDPTTPAVDDPTQTQVRILPQLDATKRATLLNDTDNDQVADPGDTLLYEVALINNGNATATALHFMDTVDPSTTLVADSVQSSQGTVQSGNNPGDTQVRVEIGSLAGSGAQATISYRATIKNPLPAQAVEVVNQGTVQSKELDPVLTDDPTTSAEQDATRTQVIASPRLQVIKQDLHWIDGDDDRQVTLNDQLLYQIKIVNRGNVAATNVLLQDTIDPRTVLVDGSVQSNQGVVQQGNVAGDRGVTLAIGAIPPNGTVNIAFRVRVNVNENGQLSNQAVVTHDQPAPSGTRTQPIQLVSDDPDTVESSDPTLTPIVRRGSQAPGSLRIYMPIVRRAR